MAEATPAGLVDKWVSLKENPVFRRSIMPRGLRSLARSPLPRAIILTAIALALYEWIEGHTLSLWPVLLLGIMFWFLIEVMQRYFCWIDLTVLSRTGTLGDYLNSGLSRADVAIGVIYPAVISETMAITGVLIWFAATAEDMPFRILLLVLVFLNARRLWDDPWIFLPDVEAYMRKRDPITLFFISLAVWVPLMIWFVILYTLLFGMSIIAGIAGLTVGGQTIGIAAFLGTWFLSKFPINWWHQWRLKRFYTRYHSFDDLFEKYIEG